MDLRGSLIRFSRAGLATTVAVGVLTSCSGGGGNRAHDPSEHVPPELRAALASVAPIADVTKTSDKQTDLLLDEVGMRAQLGVNADAVYALLDRAREKAIGAQQPPDLSKATLRAYVVNPSAAQLLAATASLSTVLEFSGIWAGALDHLTSDPGTSGASGTKVFPTSPPTLEDDGTRTVSDTISQSVSFGVSGSRVTATFSGTINQKVTDDKTHAVIAQATDTRTYHGEINVCPDPGGLVPLSLTASIRITTPAHSSTADSTLDIKGHVNDQADLGSVDASYQNKSKWDGGSVDLDLTGLSLKPTANGGYDPASLDLGKATGSLDTSGDAKVGIRWAATDLAMNAHTAEPAMKEAERLWRHGRCVFVAVPDYSAETPIQIPYQDGVRHSEDVDTSSETKFAVTLKHRFGAPPVAPVDASLSGPDKIEPDHLDAAPGSLTYTAPGEEDKSATLTLTSTSKRGIGKVLIRFVTKQRKLELTMNGTVSFGSGPVTLTAQIRGSKAPFKAVGKGVYRASLPATTNYTLGIAAPDCSGGSGSEGSGSVVFNAKLVPGPDKKPVWKVTLDPKRSKVHTSETVCGLTGIDLPGSGTAAGLAGVVASAAGVMTFPIDGGTVHVHRAVVDATFVATVPS